MLRRSLLARLSGGIAGIPGCLLLGFQSNLTLGSLGSLDNLVCCLSQALLMFGRLLRLPLCGLAGLLGDLGGLAFGQPGLTGGTDSLSGGSALGHSRIVGTRLCSDAFQHGLSGALRRAQPIAEALISKTTHALISLSRTARSVTPDLIRYETSPVSSAGMRRVTS
jgi:hypothetical protein